MKTLPRKQKKKKDLHYSLCQVSKSKKVFGYGPDLHLRKLITVYFFKVAENPKHTAILY